MIGDTAQPDIDDLRGKLREGQRIHRRFPGDGILHVDRALPFLCVFRLPLNSADPYTSRLVRGEAVYLCTSEGKQRHADAMALVRTLGTEAVAAFGAFLLLELWAAPEPEAEAETEADEPDVQPRFTIYTRTESDDMQATLKQLVSGLGKLKVHQRQAEVNLRVQRKTAPPGMASLLPRTGDSGACFSLGLEVRAIYFNAVEGAFYPMIFRALHHGLSRSLRQAFFEFTRTMTSHRPRHFKALGPRAFTRHVWNIDRRMADICDAYDFLLQVTPLHPRRAWCNFKRNRCEKPPVFHYRPMPLDPAELKKRLYNLPLDHVADPSLARLFSEKRHEMDRQLTMLQDRGASTFMYGGMQLYKPVDEVLWTRARRLLAALPLISHDDFSGGRVSSEAFAARARAEIGRLREQWDGIEARVTVTDEISGVLASRGHLLVGADLHITAARVEPLLQHEVGTHILTYWNARTQPFQLLTSGLAGYEELQEGLAVLAEYLLHGLNRARLRILAARVVAARALTDGASFIDTFRLMRDEYAFDAQTAFSLTMRIHRGGGLIKDAIYLRGFLRLLEYISRGNDPARLLIGKFGFNLIAVIDELRWRGVLQKPPLQPAWLERPGPRKRLDKLRQGHIEDCLLREIMADACPDEMCPNPCAANDGHLLL